MKYETVIGLEVHLHLATETKAFCGCSTKFGQRPNSQTCPVCLGFPGALPVLSEKAFYFSIKVALALNCKIQDLIKFDRKNYYYPDLPKNFQISQYDMPLSYDGSLEINSNGARKRIRIRRVHLEEDAGKLIHDTRGAYSLVDFNRSGIPLLEIVSEPDINSPEEAYNYLVKLKAILEYLRVSDCDMEKGSLRCDANISVREKGREELGAKVELKNMNTFKGVKQALEYEVKRQVGLLEEGENIIQETRLWDADKSVTTSMRSKEEAEDYRYFPEPDLVPFVTDRDIIEKMRGELPELPEARSERFRVDFALSEYDADLLTSQIDMADYFEECLKSYKNAKNAANWIMGDIMAQANLKNVNIKELGIPPPSLVSLLKMIDDGIISGKMAKEILTESIKTKRKPQDIVESKGLEQITDTVKLDEVVRMVLEKNEKSARDYKSGKRNAFAYLVGQVMRETKGRANPAIVNEVLKKNLGE